MTEFTQPPLPQQTQPSQKSQTSIVKLLLQPFIFIIRAILKILKWLTRSVLTDLLTTILMILVFLFFLQTWIPFKLSIPTDTTTLNSILTKFKEISPQITNTTNLKELTSNISKYIKIPTNSILKTQNTPLTDNSQVLITFNTTPSVQFNCEVAVSKDKQQLGLTYKDSLNPYDCMLFVFQEPSTTPFWTRDMNFPIDIIFLDKNKHILQIFQNIQPCTTDQCTAYAPKEPYYFVIELAGQSVSKHKITKDTTVEFITK